MKILQVISTSGFFGAENMVLSLMQGLRSEGVDVALAAFQSSEKGSGELATRATSLDHEVYVVNSPGALSRSLLHSLRELAAEAKAEVVHCHGYKADVYATFAQLRTPKVATCHNWPTKTLKMRTYAALDKMFLRLFARVVAVSNEVERELLRWRVPRQRVLRINNGVELDRFKQASGYLRESLGQDQLVVGYVGRLVKGKGLDLLIDSIAELKTEYPQMTLVLVGSGPEEQALRQRIEALSATSRVQFLGFRSDLPEVYAACDIVVLPSLDEGLPMVVLEALAARKAMIATAVGQIPQIIHDQETGLLISPGSKADLIRALSVLANDARLRERLGVAGRQLINDQYSSAAMAKSYMEVYCDVHREFCDASNTLESHV